MVPTMMGGSYLSEDDDHPVCGVCPSLRFPREGFAVADRPSAAWPFDPVDGYRYAADGTPVCVHPHKIGLEPERFAPPPESRLPPPLRPTRRRWWRIRG
jgi:hypothetical protein